MLAFSHFLYFVMCCVYSVSGAFAILTVINLIWRIDWRLHKNMITDSLILIIRIVCYLLMLPDH